MIYDFFTGVFGVLVILAIFIIPAILQVKWDDYRGKGPLLPPDDSGYDSINDRPIW